MKASRICACSSGWPAPWESSLPRFTPRHLACPCPPRTDPPRPRPSIHQPLLQGPPSVSGALLPPREAHQQVPAWGWGWGSSPVVGQRARTGSKAGDRLRLPSSGPGWPWAAFSSAGTCCGCCLVLPRMLSSQCQPRAQGP